MTTPEHQAVTEVVNTKQDMTNVIRVIVVVKLLTTDVEMGLENALVESAVINVINMGTVEVALIIAHLKRDARVLMAVVILIANQIIQK